MLKSIKLSPDSRLVITIFSCFFAIVGILIVCENVFWEPKRVFPPNGYLAHVDLVGTEGLHLETGDLKKESDEASKSQEQKEQEAWANQA